MLRLLGLVLLVAGGAVAPPGNTATPTVCPGGAPDVTTSIETFNGVPYRSLTVARPRRTIILLHGGPDAPALDAPDELDCYLARRFAAHVVKPAYFGSRERSPWTKVPMMDLTKPLTREQLSARLLRAIDAAYSGMQRSVREVGAFVDHWDGVGTTVVGESHGAVLAVLAARRTQRSAIVLIAPVIASRRAIVRAAMEGRYVLREPIDPPRLVLDGDDVTDRVFKTKADRGRLVEAVSLAYYRPWQDRTLSDILRRAGVRTSIIVGLQDRVGMIGHDDWLRFRRAVPSGTRVCADPLLGHEPPMVRDLARLCFERFMLAAPILPTNGTH